MRKWLSAMAGLWVLGGGVVLGDSAPTLMGELQNAEVVVRGRGVGDGMVEVEEVMKGVESRRFLEVAGVKAGEQVVVLERYQERRVWSGADVQQGGDARTEAPGVWPVVEQGTQVTVQVPMEGGGFGGPATNVMGMNDLAEDVATSAPEESGLEERVEEALFYPEKAAADAVQDSDEAVYVQVVIGVREMRRDVAFLAGYLEAKDPVIRAGAQRMLERLTGATVAGPGGDTEAERVAAEKRWVAWWKEHEGKLAWDEELGRWGERKGTVGDLRKWPALPVDEKLPGASGLPAGLVAAIAGKDGKPDAAALEREVRRFVDGGT